MNPWTVGAWGAGIVAGLYALHRLALWLEREGWIRYVRNPPDGGGASGAALGELQQFFEPRTKHVYDIQNEKRPRREADRGESGTNP